MRYHGHTITNNILSDIWVCPRIAYIRPVMPIESIVTAEMTNQRMELGVLIISDTILGSDPPAH